MNSFSNLNRGASLAGKLALALAGTYLACAGAFAVDLNRGPGGPSVATATREASLIGPTNNDVVGAARYLIPDGSNLFISHVPRCHSATNLLARPLHLI